MMNIINILLQPIIYLVVLLVELWRAVAPEEASMKDTIKSARGAVNEVKSAMDEFKSEMKDDEPENTKLKG